MWNFFDVFVFVAGFAACWFTKDKLTLLYQGTENVISTLEGKINTLKATL